MKQPVVRNLARTQLRPSAALEAPALAARTGRCGSAAPSCPPTLGTRPNTGILPVPLHLFTLSVKNAAAAK